ncbi:hypothetical protein ACIO93_33585 [Streptomyces sp. NPDC087903]|uniref:hypothetical protein n=1 Tax=Streptomyces sp. NPDC087903 TaxID=3365819 RepID=UPI0037FA2C86
MAEHLKRRAGGVDGALARLLADGVQEAVDSGEEGIEENLFDEIVIGQNAPDDEIAPVAEASAPARAAIAKSTRSANPGRKRPSGNPTFEDTGPNTVGLHG